MASNEGSNVGVLLMFKKFLILFFAFLLITAVGFGAFLVFYAPEKIRQTLETKGSEILEGKILIGALKISWSLPFRARLENITIKRSAPPTSAKIKSVDLEVDLLNGLTHFRHPDLKVIAKVAGAEVQVHLKTPSDSPAKSDRPPQALPQSFEDIFTPTPIKNLDFRLQISASKVEIFQKTTTSDQKFLVADHLNLDLELTRLQDPITLKLKTDVEAADFPMAGAWPVEIFDSGHLEGRCFGPLEGRPEVFRPDPGPPGTDESRNSKSRMAFAR